MCFVVRSLNLSNNLLNGSIPALNALTALTYVVRRIVCGVLESSAERYRKRGLVYGVSRSLDLSGNALTGAITSQFSALTGLQYVAHGQDFAGTCAPIDRVAAFICRMQGVAAWLEWAVQFFAATAEHIDEFTVGRRFPIPFIVPNDCTGIDYLCLRSRPFASQIFERPRQRAEWHHSEYPVCCAHAHVRDCMHV